MAERVEQMFTVKRLNTLRDESWAVIRKATGAIALDASGQLLMRLSHAEAMEIAVALSRDDQNGHGITGGSAHASAD